MTENLHQKAATADGRGALQRVLPLSARTAPGARLAVLLAVTTPVIRRPRMREWCCSRARICRLGSASVGRLSSRIMLTYYTTAAAVLDTADLTILLEGLNGSGGAFPPFWLSGIHNCPSRHPSVTSGNSFAPTVIPPAKNIAPASVPVRASIHGGMRFNHLDSMAHPNRITPAMMLLRTSAHGGM